MNRRTASLLAVGWLVMSVVPAALALQGVRPTAPRLAAHPIEVEATRSVNPSEKNAPKSPTDEPEGSQPGARKKLTAEEERAAAMELSRKPLAPGALEAFRFAESKSNALKLALEEDVRNTAQQQQQQQVREAYRADYLQREAAIAKQLGLRKSPDQRYQLSANSRATALLMQMRAREAVQQATQTVPLQVFRTADHRFQRLASWSPLRLHAAPYLVLVADASKPAAPASAAPGSPNQALLDAGRAAAEDMVATAFSEVVLKARSAKLGPVNRNEVLQALLQRLADCQARPQLDALVADPVSEMAQSEKAAQRLGPLREVTAVERIPEDQTALLVLLRHGSADTGFVELAVRLPVVRVVNSLVTERL